MISLRSLIFLLLLAVAAAGTNKEGLAFLTKKASEDGVVKLDSGLLYKELVAGTGKTPTANSPCSCHYAGTLIDGTEFDSSYKRGQPTTFAPNQVIKGCKWRIVLVGMKMWTWHRSLYFRMLFPERLCSSCTLISSFSFVLFHRD